MTRKQLIKQPIIDEFHNRRGDHLVAYDTGLLDLYEHPRFGLVQAKVQVYTNPCVYMVMLIGCDDAVDLTPNLNPEFLELVRAYLTEGFDIEASSLEDMRWADSSQQEENMLVLELLPHVCGHQT